MLALLKGNQPLEIALREATVFRRTEVGAVAAQSLLNVEGQIRHILISNDGGTEGASKHTDEVTAALEPTLIPLALEIEPVKRDAEDLAPWLRIEQVCFAGGPAALGNSSRIYSAVFAWRVDKRLARLEKLGRWVDLERERGLG